MLTPELLSFGSETRLLELQKAEMILLSLSDILG